jgi:hypothetical protein
VQGTASIPMKLSRQRPLVQLCPESVQRPAKETIQAYSMCGCLCEARVVFVPNLLA